MAQADGYVPMDRMRVLQGIPTENATVGRVEEFNSDIPLVPDKRDAPSWERLRSLEGEVAILTRKVEDLTRVIEGRVFFMRKVENDPDYHWLKRMGVIPSESDADLHDEWR